MQLGRIRKDKLGLNHFRPVGLRPPAFFGQTLKLILKFKDKLPGELLTELEKWEKVIEKEIEDIGEDKIRQHKDMGWVFDEEGDPHFEHHINQIKKALNK